MSYFLCPHFSFACIISSAPRRLYSLCNCVDCIYSAQLADVDKHLLAIPCTNTQHPRQPFRRYLNRQHLGGDPDETTHNQSAANVRPRHKASAGERHRLQGQMGETFRDGEQRTVPRLEHSDSSGVQDVYVLRTGLTEVRQHPGCRR